MIRARGGVEYTYPPRSTMYNVSLGVCLSSRKPPCTREFRGTVSLALLTCNLKRRRRALKGSLHALCVQISGCPQHKGWLSCILLVKVHSKSLIPRKRVIGIIIILRQPPTFTAMPQPILLITDAVVHARVHRSKWVQRQAFG